MRRRIWLIVAIAAAWFGLAPLAVAQEDPYTLSVSVQHSVFYPAEKWIPLRVEARNHTDREVDGYVALPVKRRDGGGVELRVPMRVPPHSRVLRSALAVFPEEQAATADEMRSGSVPAVTTAEFRSHDGARLAQQPLLARPLIPADESSFSVVAPPATTVLLTGVADPMGDFADPDLFLSDILQDAGGYASVLAPQDEDSFTRHPAALEGVRSILVSRFDLNALDIAQREALLTFVRSGGDLIVSSPDPQVMEKSWLAPHLPVQLVGQRLIDRISGTDGTTYSMPEYVPIAEALAGNGTILVQDRDFVHVALRSMGLGRLIFTSFPVNSLEPNATTRALWSRLLRNDSLPREWQETKLPEVRDSILSRMIGKSVAPWGLAAGVTGAYLLSVIGVQVLLNGVRRPGAFGLTLGIAGLISVALVAVGLTRQVDQQPMAARIVTLDTSAEDGGVLREAVAFVGADDDSFRLTAAVDGATLKVSESFTRGDQPIVWEYPFTAPKAGMRAASYQRVWSAQGPLPAELKLAAVGRFDAEGLSIRVNNELGGGLLAPRVVWERSQLPAQEHIGVGESRTRVGGSGGTSMLVSGEERLRNDVLAAALTSHSDIGRIPRKEVPRLVGFLEHESVPRLLDTSRDDLAVRSVAIVRTPLEIEPTPVGEPVRIPGEVMQLEVGDARGLPYDMSKREWLPSQVEGEPGWLIGFRPPPGIGTLRPVRLLLDANFNAPRHHVQLLRQQVQNGKATINPAGEQVVQWETPVGARDAVIKLEAGDVDASGTVWLLLKLSRAGGIDTSGIPAPWHVQWFRAGYEAEVVGPPLPGQGTVPAQASAEAETEE